MDFRDVVRRRRMVRRLSDEPVPPDAIKCIMSVAQRAPSAGYSQGIEFVVVTDEGTRAQIARIVSNRETAAEAIRRIPVQIVLCASAEIYKARYRQSDKLQVREGVSDDDLWQVPFWYVDAGCSMMLALLATVNEGLAASFIGVWRQEELKQLLGIPEAYVLIGVILIGHRAPDERPQGSVTRRRRRPLAEVLHQERW